MAEELMKGVVTLGVGMTVVFLVLGILYGMLLLMPLVNGTNKPEE
jgi:Na+-transporting methylmalonyl-CoA/oxaloacetate decarboxylase gamma subunit